MAEAGACHSQRNVIGFSAVSGERRVICSDAAASVASRRFGAAVNLLLREDLPLKHANIIAGMLSILPFTGLHAADIPVPIPRPQSTTQSKAVPPVLPTACQSKLTAIHAVFKPLPPVSDPKGCSIIDTVELSAIPGGATLTPPALLECETALTLVTFLRDTAQRTAVTTLGSTLKTFVQDSAYICRSRNGTSKLSEHAFGRAIDIGAFVTATGETIVVKASGGKDKKHDAFLAAIRTAACGPFTTVLGPGSDTDHALHFHFDVAPRKGKPFCQ